MARSRRSRSGGRACSSGTGVGSCAHAGESEQNRGAAGVIHSEVARVPFPMEKVLELIDLADDVIG